MENLTFTTGSADEQQPGQQPDSAPQQPNPGIRESHDAGRPYQMKPGAAADFERRRPTKVVEGEFTVEEPAAPTVSNALELSTARRGWHEPITVPDENVHRVTPKVTEFYATADVVDGEVVDEAGNVINDEPKASSTSAGSGYRTRPSGPPKTDRKDPGDKSKADPADAKKTKTDSDPADPGNPGKPGDKPADPSAKPAEASKGDKPEVPSEYTPKVEIKTEQDLRVAYGTRLSRIMGASVDLDSLGYDKASPAQLEALCIRASAERQLKGVYQIQPLAEFLKDQKPETTGATLEQLIDREMTRLKDETVRDVLWTRACRMFGEDVLRSTGRQWATAAEVNRWLESGTLESNVTLLEERSTRPPDFVAPPLEVIIKNHIERLKADAQQEQKERAASARPERETPQDADDRERRRRAASKMGGPATRGAGGSRPGGPADRRRTTTRRPTPGAATAGPGR